jgi:serine/threonine protein kinase
MSQGLARFKVIGQLGRGGMAEVYICRLQGIGGFEKEVVVKRIVPERADDPDFLKMFLDEARVGANLNHPNIVQVFEIGEDDGLPYIAMEYVKGVTLGMIIRQLRHKKGLVHYGHAARMIAGICEGLDYAHNAVNADGEPLRLVHRDVSPGNIVISREGVPKLLDFGVAKAAGRLSETQAGTIKGKIAYMAPEQVSQGTLDHRADIFSLGVCLYELTVGRNPFRGPDQNDVAVLKNVIHGVFLKPSQVIPDYPPALEQIVLHAIEQDVHKRCVSARDLRDRLEGFLASSDQYTSTNRSVAIWLRDLFTDFNQLTTTGSLQAFTGTPQTGRGDPKGLFSTGTQTPSGPSTSSPSSSTRQLRKSSPEFAQITGGEEQRTSPAPAPMLLEPKGSGWKWGALAVVALVAAGVWWTSMRPVPVAPVVQTPVQPAPPPTGTDDDSARTYLEGAETLAKEKRFELAAEVLGKASKLQIKSADLNIRMARLSDVIVMGGILKKASSFLKDKDYRRAIDASKAALDRDSENADAIKILSMARTGLQPTEVERTGGKAKERAHDGTLTITTTPPAMVYVDDEPLGRSPITRHPITAGFHTVQVRAQGHQPNTSKIKVASGQAVSLVVPLAIWTAGSRAGSDEDGPPPFRLPTPASPRSGIPASPTESPPAPETTTPSAGSPSTPAARASAPSTQPRSPSGSVGALPPRSSAPTTIPTPEPSTAPTPSSSPSATGAAAKPALPSGQAAPQVHSSGPFMSVMPKSPIPKPTLPRDHNARTAEQVARVCQLVEAAVVSQGGVSPEFARGITGPLRRAVGASGEMYGVAMYYFIIREASLRHDSKVASENLAAAQGNGFLLKLKNLPGNDRDL